MSDPKIRTIHLYKDYFLDFYNKQTQKVKDKIAWTLRVIETIPQVPEDYLKHLEGTNGLYEIRIKFGSNIFRIFCFFDEGKLVVLANGFQKKTQKHQDLKLKELSKLKKNMKMKNNTKTLDQFIDEQYGERGTQKREKFEKDYEEFKFGFMLQQARLEKGLTQQELADKTGTTKSYISKIENNVKEVRLSTLQKIVEVGLGGHLELSIKI